MIPGNDKFRLCVQLSHHVDEFSQFFDTAGTSQIAAVKDDIRFWERRFEGSFAFLDTGEVERVGAGLPKIPTNPYR